MKEMEHKPHEGAAGTEQDKWKSKLERKALWREWVEGAVGGEGGWLGNRGLLERHHSFLPIYHTFPLKNHHCCLFLMQKDPGFLSAP